MCRSTGFLVVVSTFAICVASVEAEPAKPQFIDAGNGDFTFDTNLVHGRLRCGGRLQGICSLIDSKSIVELADGPGLLSYYRIFMSGRRFGEAARRWPTQCQLLPDGAVAVMSPPSDCFAVSIPYNKTPPDDPTAHASLYLSLFGSDLLQGETTRSRTRMIVGRRWSDSDFIEAYTKYFEASK